MKTNQIIILVVVAVISFYLGKFIETKNTEKQKYQAFYCRGFTNGESPTKFTECMGQDYEDLPKPNSL